MNSGPTLSIGATGHDVRRLQRIFVMTKALAPNSITGTFDMTTEQAVKDFQQVTLWFDMRSPGSLDVAWIWMPYSNGCAMSRAFSICSEQ